MAFTFDPKNSFKNLLQGWWKIALVAILASLIGLAISFLLPPKYQAEAVFYASIDFSQINFEQLVDQYEQPRKFTQYDEDLALEIVHTILIQEMGTALEYARTLDPALDAETFNRDKQIQRHHAQWYLRFRHSNPQVAQAIVAFWAEQGLEALRQAQEAGRVEPYVLVDLVSLPLLPQTPIYHNRNVLVLASALAGIVLGILLVDFQDRYLTQS